MEIQLNRYKNSDQIKEYRNNSSFTSNTIYPCSMQLVYVFYLFTLQFYLLDPPSRYRPNTWNWKIYSKPIQIWYKTFYTQTVWLHAGCRYFIYCIHLNYLCYAMCTFHSVLVPQRISCFVLNLAIPCSPVSSRSC